MEGPLYNLKADTLFVKIRLELMSHVDQLKDFAIDSQLQPDTAHRSIILCCLGNPVRQGVYERHCEGERGYRLAKKKKTSL